MEHFFIEVNADMISKVSGSPCGDVLMVERFENSTLIILADGLGSGVKANIAATLCATRLKELIKLGFSTREAFASLVRTMESAIKDEMPYSVFTLARIINDGITAILSYDMPAPLLINNRTATCLNCRDFSIDTKNVKEYTCVLTANDSLLIFSDGASQAGLGINNKEGIGQEGLLRLTNKELISGCLISELPSLLQRKIFEINDNDYLDDTSVLVAFSRPSRNVNILTGPPINRRDDHLVIENFLEKEGYKIICGGTTANLVANHLGKEIHTDSKYENHFTPPKHSLEGIDLVTEGALTLNQLYNILDEDRLEMDEKNPVTELYDYLISADKIRFMIGSSNNPATRSISFRQQGFLSRRKIIPLIADKLRAMGKVVLIEEL